MLHDEQQPLSVRTESAGSTFRDFLVMPGFLQTGPHEGKVADQIANAPHQHIITSQMLQAKKDSNESPRRGHALAHK